MAYYAYLDNNNIVTEVITGNDGYDKTDAEWEQLYSEVRDGATCKKTSFNTYGGVHYGPNNEPDGLPQLRKNFAGIGFTYDATLDAFIPPKPYPSWTLDNATANWVAPVPMPNDGKRYSWDEETQSWVEVTI